MTNSADPIADHMDRIYRHQRHLYDATRRNFLVGRDALIRDLKPPVNGIVVEVGCGTARNLIEAARLYPDARFFGFDVSSVMLATAQKKIRTAGLEARITVAPGDAANFNVTQLFRVPSADRIFISYALSMIPPWRAAIEAACQQLAADGALHVVDFGQLEGIPKPLKATLYAWLRQFSVHPNAALAPQLEKSATEHRLVATVTHPFRGYATYAVLRRR